MANECIFTPINCANDVRLDEVDCQCVTLCNVDINSSSVNFDHDVYFGSEEEFVLPSDMTDQELLPGQRINPSTLAHLSESQHNKLLTILDRYPDCFVDKPGLCNALEQEIHVAADLDFRPRRLEEYRVPKNLKPEIDRQIQKLLCLGLIHEPTSPLASPLVGACPQRQIRIPWYPANS
jgi:hypothetical protein